MERMLQDSMKYKTEVVEGQARPADTTPCTAWNDLVPDKDIGALTTIIQNTAPNHIIEENYVSTLVDAILAYHSWALQQKICLHTSSDDPREWHPFGPPAIEVYLHENPATRAHVITNLRHVRQQLISEPYMPPNPTQQHSPTEDNSPPGKQEPPQNPRRNRRRRHRTTRSQTPHNPPLLRQLPAPPQGEPYTMEGTNMEIADAHPRMEGDLTRAVGDRRYSPYHT